MPFLIVTEDEYQKEISKLDSSVPTKVDENETGAANIIESELTRHEIERGRGNTPEIPQPLREVIAEEKLSGTPSSVIQKHFNVSASSISAYTHGSTSTASYNKPVDQLTKVRNRVSSRAANRLNDALKALATKDLTQEKARDIADIAKSMSTVFEKISPVKQQEDADANKHLHLHMYVPKMKTVEDYEIIDV